MQTSEVTETSEVFFEIQIRYNKSFKTENGESSASWL